MLEEIKDYGKTLGLIRNELENYIVNNNLKSLVLGISGGIDSALVASIAKPICDYIKIPLIGRSISIDSNKQSEIDRADAIGHYFCTNFKHRNLTDEFIKLSEINAFDEGVLNIDWSNNLADKTRLGNIKARIRMIYLYHLASLTKGMVLGTENLTEENLGFFTIGGDEISDYEPIKKLWKTEVYNLSEWIVKNELSGDKSKVLMDCIKADATDGLGITNTDLDQILPDFVGNSREGYLEIDNIFKKYFELISTNTEKDKILELEKTIVIQRYHKTSFKRKRPIIIERNKIL